MESPGISDFLPHFTYELMKAGAPHATIKSFRAYWNALSPRTSKFPCPLCYARGRQGWLQAVTENDIVAYIKCVKCDEHFRIPPVH